MRLSSHVLFEGSTLRPLYPSRGLDSRCHGERGALRVLLEATSDGDILKHTLLVKGVGVAFVASEEGPFPTHSASKSYRGKDYWSPGFADRQQVYQNHRKKLGIVGASL